MVDIKRYEKTCFKKTSSTIFHDEFESAVKTGKFSGKTRLKFDNGPNLGVIWRSKTLIFDGSSKSLFYFDPKVDKQGPES